MSANATVVEIGDLDNMAQDVIAATVLTQIFKPRQLASHKHHTPVAMFFDDAQSLVREGSSLVEYIRVMRSLNMTLTACVQSSEIASSIQSNVPIRFLGSTSSAIDSELMSRSIANLSYEERRWVSRTLTVGRFLGCIGGDPFILQVPHLDWMNLPANPEDIFTQNVSSMLMEPSVRGMSHDR